MKVRDIAFIIGVFGDAALQLLDNTPFGRQWGLTTYFERHGPIAALFVAGSMMYLFTGMFTLAFGQNPSYAIVFLYGMLLDVLFRVTRVMPSLDNYYYALPPLTSMIWGGIPAVAPYILRDLIKL